MLFGLSDSSARSSRRPPTVMPGPLHVTVVTQQPKVADAMVLTSGDVIHVGAWLSTHDASAMVVGDDSLPDLAPVFGELIGSA